MGPLSEELGVELRLRDCLPSRPLDLLFPTSGGMVGRGGGYVEKGGNRSRLNNRQSLGGWHPRLDAEVKSSRWSPQWVVRDIASQ